MSKTKHRPVKEGEIVKRTDEIKVKIPNSYKRFKWVPVPALYIGKPRRILSNPIRRVV